MSAIGPSPSIEFRVKACFAVLCVAKCCSCWSGLSPARLHVESVSDFVSARRTSAQHAGGGSGSTLLNWPLWYFSSLIGCSCHKLVSQSHELLTTAARIAAQATGHIPEHSCRHLCFKTTTFKPQAIYIYRNLDRSTHYTTLWSPYKTYRTLQKQLSRAKTARRGLRESHALSDACCPEPEEVSVQDCDL